MCDGFGCRLRGIEGHEAEAAAALGLTVEDDARGGDGAKGAERLREVLFSRGPREPAYKDSMFRLVHRETRKEEALGSITP